MSDYAAHTPYSHPGAHASLLRALPGRPRETARCWRELVSHYRVTPELPAGRDDDRQARWVSTILDLLKARNPAALTRPRPLEERFVGCCRDYALLVVSTLREHGLPARIRIGWAPYFTPGFVHDHVVAEWHDGERWVRGDPELTPEKFPFDTMDLPAGTFQTAGEAWLAFRAGTLEAGRYGVAPGLFGGPVMLRDYVIRELAALTGHELLLWDNWGLIHEPFDGMTPEQFALLDGVAHALADENPGRWHELAQHPDLRVPDTVSTYTFHNDSFTPTLLTRRASLGT